MADLNKIVLPDGSIAPIRDSTAAHTVSSATENNFAAFNTSGDLKDSGVKASDFMKKDLDYVTAGKLTGTTLGLKATAEGNNVTASRNFAHAEGDGTVASGTDSHAEGCSTTASNSHSHAEGYGTVASGANAHAEGIASIASGNTSHAEGEYTIAQRAYQHVFGRNNVADPGGISTEGTGVYVEIVGNGSNNSNRSNARTLDWSGNEVLAGKLTVGAGPTNNMDVATKQYVDNAIPTNGLPTGGTSGQILQKASSTDYDATWVTPTAAQGTLPTGGTAGQVLAKINSADFNAQWITISSGTTDYEDLTNKPKINSIELIGNRSLGDIGAQAKITVSGLLKGIGNGNVSAAVAGTDYVAPSSLAAVATSGSYNDLSDKPTIPTVNNGTLTIQKNGTTVTTFTANQSTAATANIVVPTATSDLTNDSDFVSDANYVHTDSNFTATEKSKLSGIAAGAEVNVQADWNVTSTSSDAYIKNKPTIPTVPTNVSAFTNDANYVDTSSNASVPTTGTTGYVLTKTAAGRAWAAPASQISKVSTTLTAAGWSNNSQSVTVSGVTTTSGIIVGPAPTSQSNYVSAGVMCTTQAANSLTFTCESTPSADLTVNIFIC